MIESIKVSNFQSIRSAEVNLGKFTCVVGSSHSGKSAFLRAIKTAILNSRGSAGNVSHWASMGAVAVTVDDSVVKLFIGKRGARYEIIKDNKKYEFTKLNGTVPEQIEVALGLAKDDMDLFFASQFDRPYMLDEPGSVVASKLGTLTNIDIIYSAAKVANSKRRSAKSELSIRKSDLSRIDSTIDSLDSIRDKKDGVDKVEKLITAVSDKYDQAEALKKLLGDILNVYKNKPKEWPDPPDTNKLIELYQRYERYASSLKRIASLQKQLSQINSELHRCAIDYNAAHSKIETLKEELGVCPVCNKEF